ncbi:MAG: LacI family DNA-binding transcriptional regulator [Sedimentisphaerales bacterium]|nr:LacI family DNA-binding transcriptional regulator [Sedimentisphaerales bacterium]
MAKKNSVPTVREVAAQCGVSEATVSRVLNSNYSNGFSVRKEVRHRITQVADELGYRPNLAAKNLVQKKTKIIGLLGYNTVFGWPSNIFQETIESLVRYLQKRHYDICTTAANLERDNTELPPWRVDGIIVLQECSPETIEQMEKTHLPYVVINGIGGPNCSSVVPDDIEGTRQAIDHLLELGHRRIAYAGPTPEHRKHMSIRDRHKTYIAELKRHGLECISGHNDIFYSAPDFLARAVLKEHATAILAYDHVIAIKILRDAHNFKIRIPEQASLMCFNDEYFCDIVTPALTTIGVPAQRMGEKAAQLLLEQIDDPENYLPDCIKFEQDLIIRSSTAPPVTKEIKRDFLMPDTLYNI